MAIKRASPSEQKVFTYWLERKVYEKRQISAMQFLRLCKDNKGPKELNELYHPGSDTVTGEGSSAGPSYQRDGQVSVRSTNPGSAGEQPGRQEADTEESPPPF